ncbi:MAG: hypothetical protein RQ899_08445 [Pseudomonadales bacterium]|nr:hypothetical protein [Pseudomonadales bacterium]
MKARQLWFTKAHQVEIREQALPAPTPSQIRVKSTCSAISAGTEMLVYRGQIPEGMALDATLASLQQHSTYPLQYGYACVGEVDQVGAGLDAQWLGKRVFAFQPHASHFITTPEQLLVLPDDITAEAAVFLANMETAVNLVLDGSPALGERVVVLGQGIVGLLLSSLLAQFPLSQLHALDGIAGRREQALSLGVKGVHDPGSDAQLALLEKDLLNGADLVYELSGVPQALNLAIRLCGFSSRVVIGSWYGSKTASIELGGNAHRNRIHLISSQVSSIAPELSGRWDKSRRFQLAWDMIRQVQPQSLITHRQTLEQADSIYALLHQTPDAVLQAVFIYE